MFRLSKACQLLLMLALTSLVGIGPAGADFYPIDIPDATYTSRTTLLPASGEVTDGRLKVFFRWLGRWPFGLASLGGGFTWSGDWGIPPLVESATTQAIGIGGRAEYEGDFILSFSSPIKTFGFEARPYINEFAPRDQLVRAEFYKGGPLDPLITLLPWSEGFGAPLEYVGSIERRVYYDQGALLFAASTTTEYFTQVRVFFRDAGAIARLRYSVGEQPAPTHAQFFARSIGRPPGGPQTDFTGHPDQVTMNVGETLRYTYLVEFRNTGEFLDVSANLNTEYFTDPPMGQYWWGGWQATEETRNKIFPLYARYYEPYTGQSITDTIRVYVRP